MDRLEVPARDLREFYLMLKKLTRFLDNPEMGLNRDELTMDGYDLDTLTLKQIKRVIVKRRIELMGSKMGAADSLGVATKTIYSILRSV